MVNSFPVLINEAIRILPFGRKHLTTRYVSWLNDPLVVRYSEQRHYHHTLDSCTAYFESMDSRCNYFLALEARDDTLGHIGNIGVAIDRHNLVADMSIMVGEKRAWGKGLATAAWRAVLIEMLNNQGMRKVTAGTMSVNQAMIKLMERSSMLVEGRRCRHFQWESQDVDLIMAARFREGCC